MAREAISGTWNEIAELWHAKSLKIIYIMFHKDVLVYAVFTISSRDKLFKFRSSRNNTYHRYFVSHHGRLLKQ